MGRGLSELQCGILLLARRNRLAKLAGTDKQHADVYHAEVLEECLGWPSLYKPGRVRKYRGHHFSRREVGVKRYASGTAALSRAMSRLESRGLIRCVQGAFCQWAGAVLTDAGLAAAEAEHAKRNAPEGIEDTAMIVRPVVRPVTSGNQEITAEIK